jgi:PAS domain S-box-containing protein
MKDKSLSLRVLIIEDSEDDVLLIIRELKKGGYNPVYEQVETAAAMKKALQEKQWDIILCDYKMPKFNAPSAIAVLKNANIDIPLIIVSGTIGEDVAIECMRLGAHDYIMKSNLSRLCPAIARELAEAEVRNKQRQAEEALQESEGKYRNLVERASDGICIAQEGTIHYANTRLAQMAGYSVEEVIDKPFIDYFTLEEVPKVLDRYKRRMAGQSVTPVYETVLRQKNGSRVDVEVNAGIITYEGKPADFVLVRDITERKRAEAFLLENEQHYRTMFENTGTSMILIEEDMTISMANREFARNSGYSIDEINGRMKWTEIVHPDDLRRMVEQHRLRRESQGSALPGYELRYITKTGDLRDALLSIQLIPGTKKSVASVIDITDRKQMEKKLMNSEEKFRTLAESSPFAIMVHQGDYWIYANRAAVEISGYTEEELYSMRFWDFVHPDHKNMGKQIGLDRQQGKVVPRDYELKIITKNGAEKWVSLTGNKIQYEDKPTALISVIDITERKQAEKELHKSEEKYRSLVENAREGIFQSTAEGHHITVNQAFANILGYESPEEVIATITDISHQVYVHPDDRIKILQIIEKEGSVKGYEAEFYKKDGSKTWVSINMHAVRDEEGHLLYYQGIDQDVTEKKNMETERQQNIERLKKSLGATINAMAVTVETRDPYTAGHQRRVADLALAISVEMNLKREQIDSIRMASMIHDIGKISIPSEILSKPSKLTNLEFDLIKTHSQSGYDILKDIEFPWPLADFVLQHHERMNGSGYPRNLKGDEIFLEALIMAVADVVEAMASYRPYRPALGIELALEEIEKNKGILYDDAVVNACLKLFREKSYHLK